MTAAHLAGFSMSAGVALYLTVKVLGGGIAVKEICPRCHSIIATAGVLLFFACHRFIAAAPSLFHGRHAFIDAE